MKQHYEFTYGYAYKGLTADAVGEELERINEHYGQLTPELVLEESRSEDALLHRCFQWDDAIAAEQWRREQARHIINSIKVVVINEDVKIAVRAFVNVSPGPGEYRRFVPMAKVIENKEAYNDLLEQARGDMEDFITKYSQIEELNVIKAEMLKELSK